jgi:hypothetical protein
MRRGPIHVKFEPRQKRVMWGLSLVIIDNVRLDTESVVSGENLDELKCQFVFSTPPKGTMCRWHIPIPKGDFLDNFLLIPPPAGGFSGGRVFTGNY